MNEYKQTQNVTEYSFKTLDIENHFIYDKNLQTIHMAVDRKVQTKTVTTISTLEVQILPPEDWR